MLRKAGYINGVSGDLFVVEQMPVGVSRDKTPVVIILQPLFEELNMARRYINAVCRELSSQGFATLRLDLSCSGDSTGECENADWQNWRDDVLTACRYLTEREYFQHYVLAIRGGCLLVDAIESSGAIKIDGGVLLKPLLFGSDLVTSLLRLRAFSSGFGNRRVEKVSELRKRIDDGDSLEIAGTVISSRLFQELASSKLEYTANSLDTKFTVIDIIAIQENNKRESQAVAKLNTLSTDGESKVSLTGPLFWTSIEYKINTAQISNLVHRFRFFDETQSL